MSYTKAMKWQRTHRKGTKQPVIMHTDSGFWPSTAFCKKWVAYAEALEKDGKPYLDCEAYYNATLHGRKIEPPKPIAVNFNTTNKQIFLF